MVESPVVAKASAPEQDICGSPPHSVFYISREAINKTLRKSKNDVTDYTCHHVTHASDTRILCHEDDVHNDSFRFHRS